MEGRDPSQGMTLKLGVSPWGLSFTQTFRIFDLFSASQKRGLSFRGVAFMTLLVVLKVLAVLESTLPSGCLSYKIQDTEATVAVLTVLAVSAVVVVSVMTAMPTLNSTPLFRDPDIIYFHLAENL